MTAGDQDGEQLRLLSIFDYVVGGNIAFLACIPGMFSRVVLLRPSVKHLFSCAPQRTASPA
jgi:hypothetical protein